MAWRKTAAARCGSPSVRTASEVWVTGACGMGRKNAGAVFSASKEVIGTAQAAICTTSRTSRNPTRHRLHVTAVPVFTQLLQASAKISWAAGVDAHRL